jgi:putative oxidoreductase
MFRFVCRTGNNPAPLLLRLALGAVFLAHGSQKVIGMWGGPGFKEFYASFPHGHVAAICVMAAEFLGGLGLIVGFLGRIAAAGICAVMVGAIYYVHWANGFFMNWSGAKAGEGFEYHVLAIAMLLAILIMGSGPLSVDRFLSANPE